MFLSIVFGNCSLDAQYTFYIFLFICIFVLYVYITYLFVFKSCIYIYIQLISSKYIYISLSPVEGICLSGMEELPYRNAAGWKMWQKIDSGLFCLRGWCWIIWRNISFHEVNIKNIHVYIYMCMYLHVGNFHSISLPSWYILVSFDPYRVHLL